MADRHVTDALARACEAKGYKFAEGVAQSKDSFYGQHDPDSMPNSGRLHQRWEAWERAVLWLQRWRQQHYLLYP